MSRFPSIGRTLNYGNPINWGWIVNHALVGRWKVVPQGGKGSTLLNLYHRNHGTFATGSVFPTWTSARGRPGGFGAISFAASADLGYLETGITTDFTDFTIACWFYATDNTTGVYHRLADKKYDTGFWMGHNGAAGGDSWGGGILEAGSPFGTFVALPLNTWNFLAMVRLGTTKNIYGYGGDGTYVTSSTAVSGSAVDATSLRFGNDNAVQVGAGMAGLIDDWFLYARGLSESEVAALYNDTRRGSPLSLNWRPSVTIFDTGAVAGNRRRRVLLGAAA